MALRARALRSCPRRDGAVRRPVAARANLIAASTDSAPEFAKKTLSRCGTSASSAASEFAYDSAPMRVARHPFALARFGLPVLLPAATLARQLGYEFLSDAATLDASLDRRRRENRQVRAPEQAMCRRAQHQFVRAGPSMRTHHDDVAFQVFGRPRDRLIGSPFGYPAVAGETTELDMHADGHTRIVEMRAEHPGWGPRTIGHWLGREGVDPVPAYWVGIELGRGEARELRFLFLGRRAGKLHLLGHTRAIRTAERVHAHDLVPACSLGGQEANGEHSLDSKERVTFVRYCQ